MPEARPFAAVLGDPRSRELLKLALRGRVPPPADGHVMFCATWSDLVQQVLSHPPRVVVFDCRAEGFSMAALERLRRALPSGALVAWASAGPQEPELVARLLARGVDGVFLPDGRGSADRLARILDEAMAAALRRRVIEGLGEALPASLEPFMAALLRATLAPCDVGTAARLHFSTPRTLRRQLKRAGLPAPARLISWCRLFHAAFLLENPRRTVLNVALVLHFPSANALRNRLKRYARLTPSELRRGGLRQLLDEFVRRHGEGS